MADQGLRHMMLVSCGETVRFWDFNALKENEYEHELQIGCKGFDRNKNDVTNKRDIFASVPVGGKSLWMTNCANDGFNDGEMQLNINVKATCTAYTKQHQIILGTTTGEVFLWDSEANRNIKKFSGHNSEVTCVAVNADDTHFASGTMNGTVLFHNLVSGVFTRIAKSFPNASQIKKISYNPGLKSMLGYACDDGSVNIYNVNSGKRIVRLDAYHKAPAMDLSFCTLNPQMLASVGLDRRVNLYDLRSKKHVMIFQCEQTLRSVTYASSANQILVGNSVGQVVSYDVRQTTNYNPVCITTLNAHKSPVHQLMVTNIYRSKQFKSQTYAASNIPAEIASPVRHASTIDMYDIISPIHDPSEVPGTVFNFPGDTLNESLPNANAVTTLPKKTESLPIQTEKLPRFELPETPEEEDLYKTSKPDLRSFGDSTVNTIEENSTTTSPVKEISQKLNTDQMNDLKEHLSNVMSEMKYSSHLEYMHLLTKIVKFNVDLQDEIKCLREECQDNRMLLDEVVRLREENKHLKSAY